MRAPVQCVDSGQDDPRFAAAWFTPYRPLIDAIGMPDDGACGWIERANAIAAERGLSIGDGGQHRLRFVPSDPAAAADYEARIAESGEVATRLRGDAAWHDWFNALVWLSLPRTKSALNRAHVTDIRRARAGTGRGRRRDRLTLLDENGACVLAESDWAGSALRAHDWQALFVEGRSRFAAECTVLVFGHGLLQRLMTPYKAACAHARVLHVPRVHATHALTQIDERLSQWIGSDAPIDTTPLPVLGVPGWWRENASPDFYRDSEVFRPARPTTMT